jgi:ribosome-binding protein aMBF1 (putative translation factor)
MRKLKKLTSFKEFEERILKNKKLSQVSKTIEPEYQLACSLIELRLKRNLSQTALAKKIGTKQPVISRLENMTSKPTFSMLQKIAAAFNVQLRIVFK